MAYGSDWEAVKHSGYSPSSRRTVAENEVRPTSTAIEASSPSTVRHPLAVLAPDLARRCHQSLPSESLADTAQHEDRRPASPSGLAYRPDKSVLLHHEGADGAGLAAADDTAL